MADAVKAIVVCVVIIIALFFGFCCHFLSQRRRDEEFASRHARATQQTAPGNTNQNNMGPVYIVGLQGGRMNSNTREDGSHSGEEQSNENETNETSQSPDPIADNGPPPYGCLATSDEAPPPSYEEALRASTEDLTATRHHYTA